MYSSMLNYTWQACATMPVVAQVLPWQILSASHIIQLCEQNLIMGYYLLIFLVLRAGYWRGSSVQSSITTHAHHQLSLPSFSYTLLTLPSPFPYPSPQCLPTSWLPRISLLLQKSNAKLMEGINSSTDTLAIPTEALDLVAILHWTQ